MNSSINILQSTIILYEIFKMSKTVQSHVLKEFEIKREMGSGAYGHVWEVKDRKSG